MFGLQPPPSHPAQYFELDPMRYELTSAYGGRSQGGMSLCLVAGIAVLFVYMAMNNAPSCRMMHFPADMAPRAHAMVSNVAAMAAPLVETVNKSLENIESVTAPSTIGDASKEFPEVTTEKVALAVKGTASDTTKVDKDVRDWLAKNSDGMLVIFASWCPHCKTLMKRVGKEVKPSSAPKILFVDGDKWRDIFSGEKALCTVDHFPQAMKKQVGSDVLVKVHDPVEEVEKVVEDVDTEKEAEKEMLQMLF